MEQDEFDPADLPPSKTRRKKDADALQQLGTDLLELPETDWVKLSLPDSLIDALREMKRIHSRSALKRQRQFIGRLMRDVDPEPVQQHFEQLRQKTRQQVQAHHALEEWRDRMIGEDDSVVEAYLQEYGNADRQHLRQLVRQARKERDQSKPPKSARALFRYLREMAK
ncbi:ribosome-associated protein [Thiogranum longum]|uniref:Dual-action ribosomal maturation protein DarP n=1 Tax=Thiogranum longum TaxID=1537524 RepID=A0A4R1H6Z2_9GAMM|nr:ribosome biogenesis factor YjgA [Thiogranum longum]TCK17547.1 ribosome-associated protein [Thiogranum longum]